MAKYSFEFKLKVVKEYLDGKGGYKCLSNKFGISAYSILANWVASFREFGEEGLMRSRENKNYSLNFKLDAIQYYITTEISYRELAVKLGMNNPSLIALWVSAFRKKGVEGISRPKGRPPNMKKKSEEKNQEKVLPDINKIEELEAQILSLQIENAYLKELRRLRLMENQKTKKSQELSASSEEDSD